jgi:hypothetical protein
LIIGTNLGEIYFIDIDNNKIVSTCETKAGEINFMIQLHELSILLVFSKKSEIFGVYLPPHSKKFKPSCHLINDQSLKICSVNMSQQKNRCYLGS